MKYKVVEDFESIFHDHYDENVDGDIVYMWFAEGDILDDEEEPFIGLTLAMYAEDGKLLPVENEKE